MNYGASLADALMHIANAKDALIVLRNETEGQNRDQATYGIGQLDIAFANIHRAWSRADYLTGGVEE